MRDLYVWDNTKFVLFSFVDHVSHISESISSMNSRCAAMKGLPEAIYFTYISGQICDLNIFVFKS